MRHPALIAAACAALLLAGALGFVAGRAGGDDSQTGPGVAPAADLAVLQPAEVAARPPSLAGSIPALKPASASASGGATSVTTTTAAPTASPVGGTEPPPPPPPKTTTTTIIRR